ncbi:MAG: hypothetical protein LBS74_11345 [Oscillospiraceae bacterium]|jgi:hypothetical protein|nr:hypothetical protein [Oscillospiraceae bacterium]
MVNVCFKNDFSFSESNIDTIFYVDIEGQCFPDEQWTDFIVPVLEMWINNLSTNYNASKAGFKLYFMDGPYYIECQKENSQLKMKFIEDRSKRRVVIEDEVDFFQFTEQLLITTSYVINFLSTLKLKKAYGLADLKRAYKTLKGKAEKHEKTLP